MQVVLDIPDEMARQIAANGEGLSRAALEALALEGYRTQRLSASEVRRLLGFRTRMEVYDFLAEHEVDVNYTVADLEHDRETMLWFEAKRQAELVNSVPPSN